MTDQITPDEEFVQWCNSAAEMASNILSGCFTERHVQKDQIDFDVAWRWYRDGKSSESFGEFIAQDQPCSRPLDADGHHAPGCIGTPVVSHNRTAPSDIEEAVRNGRPLSACA